MIEKGVYSFFSYNVLIWNLIWNQSLTEFFFFSCERKCVLLSKASAAKAMVGCDGDIGEWLRHSFLRVIFSTSCIFFFFLLTLHFRKNGNSEKVDGSLKQPNLVESLVRNPLPVGETSTLIHTYITRRFIPHL